MKSVIPLRPEGIISPLSQDEQTALTWLVISGCSRKSAYITFARPDMLDSKAKAAIDDHIRQFFAQREVKEYIEAYEKTLDGFLHPTTTSKDTAGTMEERKAKAKAKAVEFAMSLADNIETANDPETVLKLMDKVGLLDGDDEVEEQPRRYLPESCNHCAYRQFCEENTEDMCPKCRYYQYGEENGVHFKKENLLAQ